MREDPLNTYRLDVDEAMAEAQVRAQHADAVDTWRRIEAELIKGGPFATMLDQFRTDATEAMSELVYADATDIPLIRSLQAAVRRSLDTMEKIDGFRSAAEAVDANAEAIDMLSDEDDEPLPPPDDD